MFLIASVTNPKVQVLDLIQITSDMVFSRFFSKDLPPALIMVLLIPIFLASMKWIGRLCNGAQMARVCLSQRGKWFGMGYPSLINSRKKGYVSRLPMWASPPNLLRCKQAIYFFLGFQLCLEDYFRFFCKCLSEQENNYGGIPKKIPVL